jgi:hypothetical protein
MRRIVRYGGACTPDEPSITRARSWMSLSNPGGERPGKRVHLELFQAKHSRVYACQLEFTAERLLLNRMRGIP